MTLENYPLAKIKIFYLAADAPWKPENAPIPNNWSLDWYINPCTIPLCEFMHANDPRLLAEEVAATMVAFENTHYMGREFRNGDMFVMCRDKIVQPNGEFAYTFLDKADPQREAVYASYGWDCIRSLRWKERMLVFVYSTKDPREEGALVT